MIIYLARHGQTTGDLEKRYGGDYDDHLTETGQQQAAQLAERLTNEHIEMLFASPKFRAQEAAGIVANRLNLQVQTLPEFRERNGYGIMTGMVKEEAARQYPEYVKELQQDVHYAVEGAETYVDFQARITAALRTLTDMPAVTLAVVTHGGPIRLVFRDVLKLGEIEVDDCAYVVLEAINGQYKLLRAQGIRVLG